MTTTRPVTAPRTAGLRAAGPGRADTHATDLRDEAATTDEAPEAAEGTAAVTAPAAEEDTTAGEAPETDAAPEADAATVTGTPPATDTVPANATVPAPDEVTAVHGARWIATAAVTVGVVNYVYALALTRLLDVGSYATFAAGQGLIVCTAAVAVVTVPWMLAQALARTRSDAERGEAIRFAVVTAIVGGVLAATVVGAVAHQFAGLGTTLVIGASTLLIYVTRVCVGWLQGTERLRTLASLTVVEAVLKLGIGLFLVTALDLGATGALAAFGIAVAPFTLFLPRRYRSTRRRPWLAATGNRELWRRAVGVASLQGVIALMAALDVVLVAMLPTDRSDAASYQAAVMLGRVPLFLAGAVSIAFLPALSRRRAGTPLATRAMGMYLTVALPLAVVAATAPGGVLTTVFPDEYTRMSTLMACTAVAGLALGALSLLVTFSQAVNDYGVLRPLLVGLVCYVTGLSAGWAAGGVLGMAIGGMCGTGVALGVLLVREAGRRRSAGPSTTRRTAPVLRALLPPLLLAGVLLALRPYALAWLIAAVLTTSVALYRFFAKRSTSVPHDPHDPPTENDPPGASDDPSAPEGPNGPQGPENPQGPNGPQGPENPQGPNEPQGPENPQGPNGPRGPENPQGLNEPNDPQGPQARQATDDPHEPSVPEAPSRRGLAPAPDGHGHGDRHGDPDGDGRALRLLADAVWRGDRPPASDEELHAALGAARSNRVEGPLARAYPRQLAATVDAVSDATRLFRRNLVVSTERLGGAGIPTVLIENDPSGDHLDETFGLVVPADRWKAARTALDGWYAHRSASWPDRSTAVLLVPPDGPSAHLGTAVSWFGVPVIAADRLFAHAVPDHDGRAWLVPCPADRLRIRLAHGLFRKLSLDLAELLALRELLAPEVLAEARTQAAREGWFSGGGQALALAMEAMARLDRGELVRLPLPLPVTTSLRTGAEHAGHLLTRGRARAAVREVAVCVPLVVTERLRRHPS
ncbi:hypothetical protein ACIPPS_13460 [Streptomyces sp. NPDC090127]|uniref:hypothetical protein n=1 Tax=Streptomyces sp. NPDC090127 TaxID=3365953 RepID=UPI0037FB5DD4